MFLDLHPLVIHFPIALFSSAVLFDFIAVIFKKDELLITRPEKYDKKKDIRTLNWYQRFWDQRQNKTI